MKIIVSIKIMPVVKLPMKQGCAWPLFAWVAWVAEWLTRSLNNVLL